MSKLRLLMDFEEGGENMEGRDQNENKKKERMPESSSSSQGFNLKRWMVLANEAASPNFLLDCLLISSLRFSFILLQKY